MYNKPINNWVGGLELGLQLAKLITDHNEFNRQFESLIADILNGGQVCLLVHKGIKR